MRSFATLLLTAATAAAFSAGASAANITLQNGLHSYTGASDLYIPASDKNYGGATLVDSFVSRPVLFRFDVSSLSGNVSAVNSATLTLYEHKTSNTLPTTFSVNLYSLVTADAGWVEGNGNGATATTGQTTGWHLHYPSTNWAGGGAFSSSDYSASPVASFTYDNSVANGTPIVITLPTSLVQGWINGANAGLVMINSTTGDAQVSSSSNATQALRPSLYIDYNQTPEPGTGALILVGGGLMALRRRRK